MNKDDFTKKVTSKLDTLATHHKAKPVVMNHVLETIQDRPSPHYSMWRMKGFALAAAITGFVITQLYGNDRAATKSGCCYSKTFTPNGGRFGNVTGFR